MRGGRPGRGVWMAIRGNEHRPQTTAHRPQRTEQPFLINSSKRRMRRLEMVGQIGKEYRTEDSGENGPREWNSWQNQVGTPPVGTPQWETRESLCKTCENLWKTEKKNSNFFFARSVETYKYPYISSKSENLRKKNFPLRALSLK